MLENLDSGPETGKNTGELRCRSLNGTKYWEIGVQVVQWEKCWKIWIKMLKWGKILGSWNLDPGMGENSGKFGSGLCNGALCNHEAPPPLPPPLVLRLIQKNKLLFLAILHHFPVQKNPEFVTSSFPKEKNPNFTP